MSVPHPQARMFGLLTLALVLTLLGCCVHGQDEDSLECYQFTWPGMYMANNDTSEIDVDDLCEGLADSLQVPENKLPCNFPFIYTVPANRPPNITELNRICGQQYCERYTCSEPKKCIKWSVYDVTGNIVYYSSFCGTMSDNTDSSVTAKEITNECWQDKNVSFTSEACSCDTQKCNTGTYTVQPAWTLLPFLLALITAVYYM